MKPGMTDQVGHIIDVSATFRDITGAEYPKAINGNKTQKTVGKSLLPIFDRESSAKRMRKSIGTLAGPTPSGRAT